ncbi:MAG TPA: hypothetical protein VFY17_01745 [Pilimelia sp.]|nr:hypothetical protein [Pilimelia sp.]
MGALVTVDVAPDAAEDRLPWLITFGPFADQGAWEPVVCGPYERAHAIGLAGAVAADEDVVAVVEPMWPKVSPAEIRAALDRVRRQAAEADAYAGDPYDGEEAGGPPPGETPAPDPAEVRAGFARVLGTLPAAD